MNEEILYKARQTVVEAGLTLARSSLTVGTLPAGITSSLDRKIL